MAWQVGGAARLALRRAAMQARGVMDADWTGALQRARAHAPFLALALDRRPDLAALLAEGQGEAALELARYSDASETGVALRRERLALALVLGIGDLAGAFPLLRVTGELSRFADAALDRAIAHVIAERMPDAEPRGMVALALGKQGAGELNYSSDIDPILLFDPRTLPHRDREDAGEAAQRYARKLVELLSQQTSEGYVQRVDLRLRPASEVSPLAISFDAALSHYESSALAWERAAYIRARAAGGDIAAGEAFLDDIRPFVWRRNLDFTAIEEIRRLTRRIRQAYRGPVDPGPGFDVKKGRGGIREVEFFAQTHQLIYGGRDPSLRCRGTRSALDALAAASVVKAEDAQVLGDAYDRLRQIEHRLQMVADRQTHTLPDSPDALDNVARLDGLAGGAALLEELRGICAGVAARYDDLLGDDAAEVTRPSLSVDPALRDTIEARCESWRGSIRALRGLEARKAFDAIVPSLIDAFAGASEPERALARWETLLGRLPSAINLFRLFEQRPGLLDQVLRLLTLARPLADELARRPELLDALIDKTALDLPGPVEALAARMHSPDDGDYQDRLDRIRRVVGEERFALGLQLIEARHDPLEIAEGLCRVAEAALRVGTEAAIGEFAVAHGRMPGQELVILGLGRLGGGALTHASDLDLVYLFTGDIGGASDGDRALSASLYFNRLSARVTAALSVPTAEGSLYEIDTRLRPQGAQGPLATSLEGFARYQREQAWTWEHMALCRARPVYGSQKARQALQELVRDVLEAKQGDAGLREEVLAMRARMAEHKAASGPLDVKLARGGLVDVEFIVHFLQLSTGTALVPEVDRAIADFAARGLLPADFARYHAQMTRLLVSARLLAPDAEEPTGQAREVLATACGCADYAALLAEMRAARAGVARVWQDMFDERLEIE